MTQSGMNKKLPYRARMLLIPMMPPKSCRGGATIPPSYHPFSQQPYGNKFYMIDNRA